MKKAAPQFGYIAVLPLIINERKNQPPAVQMHKAGGWFYKAIPHNSKCRYGERGTAAAKPKAQIILCVLSSILATQMPCRSRR
ncbi:MAG: hypothetical protein WBO79_02405, partial [Gemmiger qucibialis]